MSFGSINWLAVLASVIFTMISGSVWFTPKTFFTTWWKAVGKEGDEPKGTPVTWILVVVTSALQAIAFALILSAVGSASGGITLGLGLLTGVVVWVGFVAATGLTNKLFSSRYKAWMIEAGNHLVNFLAFGVIFGLWR